jgi:hypothetical protein
MFRAHDEITKVFRPSHLITTHEPSAYYGIAKVLISPQFPLLALPVEIRLEILRHYLPRQVRYSFVPKPVDVHYHDALFALGQERWTQYTPAWAKRKRGIKDLMLVCRQLHNELENLLNTKHIFSFKCHPNLNNLHQSVVSLSANAKKIPGQVLVTLSLSLPFSETMDKASILRSCYLDAVKQGFTYLRHVNWHAKGLRRCVISGRASSIGV